MLLRTKVRAPETLFHVLRLLQQALTKLRAIYTTAFLLGLHPCPGISAGRKRRFAMRSVRLSQPNPKSNRGRAWADLLSATVARHAFTKRLREARRVGDTGKTQCQVER